MRLLAGRLCLLSVSLFIVQVCEFEERPRRARGRFGQPLQLTDGSSSAATAAPARLYELLELSLRGQPADRPTAKNWYEEFRR